MIAKGVGGLVKRHVVSVEFLSGESVLKLDKRFHNSVNIPKATELYI